MGLSALRLPQRRIRGARAVSLRRSGFKPYEMRHCEECKGARPHTRKGQCVACDQRAKATTPGRRVYLQARALQRAKKARTTPKVSLTKQAAKDALPIAQAIVKRRAKGQCECCGEPAPHGHVHHRLARRMGGTARVAVNSASNLLYLLPDHHERVESNRTWAYQQGFLITQSADPAKVPVRLHSGWVLLADDGTMTRADPPETEVS